MRKLLKSCVILFSLLLVGVFLFVPKANADTNVSGIISSSTTWTLEGSPYIVTGNTLIKENVLLRIEPGVIIKFAKSPIRHQGYSIQIDGTLIAKGRRDKKIIFTSASSNPLPGDWGTIYFSDKSTDWNEASSTGSIMDYCVIGYGGNDQERTSSIKSTLIQIDDASPLIQNSTLWLSHSNDFRINGGSPEIINNIINNGGITISRGTPYFSGNKISDREGFDINGGSPRITKNNIVNNQGYTYGGGIKINGGSPVITYNNIVNNSKNGIGIIGCSGSEMGCSPVIHNNNIYNNERFAIMLLDQSTDIDASSNWWGTTSTSSIDTSIWDQKDDYTLGLVNYEPFLANPEPEAPILGDITPPVITLLGENPVTLHIGDSYTDPGYTASDNVDGDITSNVVVSSDTIDTSIPRTYIITYNVSDAAGNPATEVTRTININTEELLPSPYSQVINLSPGWNIVSPVRILESHSFSAPEVSENFDIYVLDPSKVSKWATMADLGQTEFQPLYGYFINNKTKVNQSLVLNYLEDVSPAQRLFERTFKVPGWYSIGVANPTYAQKSCPGVIAQDAHNNSNILVSLNNQFDSILDLTHGNSNSVAVSSVWKNATSDDLNSIHDLRELKGYVIYINSNNASYSGFQNTDTPSCPAGPPSPEEAMTNITDSICIDNPPEGNILGSNTSTTSVDLLKFNVQVEGLNAAFKSGSVTLTDSSNRVASVELWDGTTLLASAVPRSGTSTISWPSLTLPISADTTETLTIKANLMQLSSGYNDGDVVMVSHPYLNGIDANNHTVEVDGSSITGHEQHIFLEAPTFTYVSKEVNITGTDSNIHPSDTANVSFAFAVTANNGAIYIPEVTTSATGIANALVKPSDATGTISTTWSCDSPSDNSTAPGYWYIPSGSTANCTFNNVITNTDGTAGWFKDTINSITWNTEASTTSTSTINQTWGLTDLNTGDFYLGN